MAPTKLRLELLFVRISRPSDSVYEFKCRHGWTLNFYYIAIKKKNDVIPKLLQVASLTRHVPGHLVIFRFNLVSATVRCNFEQKVIGISVLWVLWISSVRYYHLTVADTRLKRNMARYVASQASIL